MSRDFVETGHFVCECGREFEKSQSLYAHQGKCKIHLGDRYDPEKHKGWNVGDARAWSRGKTKETDESLSKMSKSLKRYYMDNDGAFKGRKHTEQFKTEQSKRAKHNATNHLNGWKAGDSKVPNQYEIFAENFLKVRNIPYQREVVIPQSQLGKKGSYYQLDFVVNGNIDLEIDGSSHNEKHDNIRDKYVGKLFKVYRINHKDSMSTLENLLYEFIKSIDMSV